MARLHKHDGQYLFGIPRDLGVLAVSMLIWGCRLAVKQLHHLHARRLEQPARDDLGLVCVCLLIGKSAPVFYLGYLSIGGVRLYRSITLAIILAPLLAGFPYNYKPQVLYIVGLVTMAHHNLDTHAAPAKESRQGCHRHPR